MLYEVITGDINTYLDRLRSYCRGGKSGGYSDREKPLEQRFGTHNFTS